MVTYRYYANDMLNVARIWQDHRGSKKKSGLSIVEDGVLCKPHGTHIFYFAIYKELAIYLAPVFSPSIINRVAVKIDIDSAVGRMAT